MKNLNYFLIILLSAAIIYHFTFPNEIKIDHTEIIKGDTITTVTNQKKFDSLKYFFKAELKRLKASQFAPQIEKTPTQENTKDSISIYSARFFVGDSILGTSGIVKFGLEPQTFAFDSIEYRYPEILKSSTDTLKIYSQSNKPFYLDEWFYSTVAFLFVLLFAK